MTLIARHQNCLDGIIGRACFASIKGWENRYKSMVFPCCDVMGELMAGPNPAKRLKLEVAARLNPEGAG